MANYYYDCEFLEGKQDKRFLGIKYGETKPTIDLISIGIISEDNQEYYAISKEFNLKEAWNRYDLEMQSGDMRNIFPEGKKNYWIRENVLKPIFENLCMLELYSDIQNIQNGYKFTKKFIYKDFKYLLEKHGKTNKQIVDDIKFFIADGNNDWKLSPADYHSQLNKNNEQIFFKGTNLYGYYSSYDHVCLSWLFGKMINLPAGFPMYTKDLKQILDEKQDKRNRLKEIIDQTNLNQHKCSNVINPVKLKDCINYPKQKNEHSAIYDARWNKELHEFLKTI